LVSFSESIENERLAFFEMLDLVWEKADKARKFRRL
jgi:hypothetical protein